MVADNRPIGPGHHRAKRGQLVVLLFRSRIHYNPCQPKPDGAPEFSTRIVLAEVAGIDRAGFVQRVRTEPGGAIKEGRWLGWNDCRVMPAGFDHAAARPLIGREWPSLEACKADLQRFKADNGDGSGQTSVGEGAL